MIDLGSLQTGESNLAGTARKSVVVLSSNRASSLGVNNGDSVKVSTERGTVTLPAQIESISDDHIWIPRNSLGSQSIVALGAASGVVVSVVKA